jgi:hypothetical protein
MEIMNLSHIFNIMRICLDLGQFEKIDSHTIASELLALGAKRDDQLVTFYAGERTAFPAGRLADLTHIKYPDHPAKFPLRQCVRAFGCVSPKNTTDAKKLHIAWLPVFILPGSRFQYIPVDVWFHLAL